MKNKYYVIANDDKESPSLPHSNQWPKVIAFSFENMSILILLGRGHGLMGGAESLSEFDPKIWDDVFQETNSKWFQQIIENGVLASAGGELAVINELAKKNDLRIIEY